MQNNCNYTLSSPKFSFIIINCRARCKSKPASKPANVITYVCRSAIARLYSYVCSSQLPLYIHTYIHTYIHNIVIAFKLSTENIRENSLLLLLLLQACEECTSYVAHGAHNSLQSCTVCLKSPTISSTLQSLEQNFTINFCEILGKFSYISI